MPAPTVSQPLTTWQRLIYGLAFGVIFLVSLLPLPVHYLFADLVLFPLVYHIIGYRRRIVQQHLMVSFPEKGVAERHDLERQFYHWFCDYVVETIKLFSMSRSEMKRRMSFEGTEEVKALLGKGTCVGLYLGHLCNWEWVSSIPLWFDEHDKEMSQVYHVLENPVMDHLMLHNRGRMGSANVSMQEILRFIIGKQREGKAFMTGFIADQTPTWNNIHLWLPFLGHPETPVFTGAERLIKRFDMAAVFLHIQRVRRGYYKATFRVMAEQTGDTPDYQLTEQYFALLEENIRKQPECYLWTHNRWKRTREEYDRLFPNKK